MGTVAKEKASDVKPLDAGAYLAVCCAVIDLGVQIETYNNKINEKSKILLIWDLLDETYEVDGETRHRQLAKEFSLSLDKKSNLRKVLETWRGRAFTPDELDGFDVKNILNAGCQLSVTQVVSKKNGNTYANVAGVFSLPKGMKVKPVSEPIYFNLDIHGENEINTLPEWIQKKIRNSITYKDKFGVPEGFSEVTDDVPPPTEENHDLPF